MNIFVKKFNPKKFLLLWLPVLFWAGIIFLFSALPVNAVGARFDLLDFIFKKLIHIAEYALLATLIFRALYQTFSHQDFTKYQATTFLISLLYAVSDEYHQSFTSGRNGTVRDVLIDGMGIVLALYLIKKLKENKKYYKLRKVIFG